MAYTKYGEFMRIERIKNHEVMGDTAKMLNVKIPFISAVENGKRNIPEDWIPKIIAHYHLNEGERAYLLNAIDESKTQMKINLKNATQPQRRVAIQFQRSFDKLDEDTAEKIMSLLTMGDS